MLFWKSFHAQVYSMSYWYIDNATTATEISCSSIQPCSHHTSNLSSPHDYPQPKPLLWCYIIPNTHCLSCQLWNTAYTVNKVDIVFSNSEMCHYHRHTLNAQTFLNHLAILTVPFQTTTRKQNIQNHLSVSAEGVNKNPLCRKVLFVNEKYIKRKLFCFNLTFNSLQNTWKKINPSFLSSLKEKNEYLPHHFTIQRHI